MLSFDIIARSGDHDHGIFAHGQGHYASGLRVGPLRGGAFPGRVPLLLILKHGARPAVAEGRDLAWFAGRRLIGSLARLHEAHLGGLDGMIAAIGPGLTRAALLAGDLEGCDPESVAGLRSTLVGALARYLAARHGRPPLMAAHWRTFLHALSGARTLREAIARSMDCFDAVDGRLGRMALRVDRDHAFVQLDSQWSCKDGAACAIDLYGLAQIHGLFGWLVGTALPVSLLALDYDRATFDSLGLPDTPAELQVDAGWTGLRFALAFLDYPVVRDAEQVTGWAKHSFLAGFSRLSVDEKLAANVRAMALDSLRRQRRLPSFDQIVARLGGSRATVRRRLAEEGTSYREIKASCRRELALDLLRRRELSIEEIAARLDFCDSDAFREAFRGWIGSSPSEFRESVAQ